jgi:tetratricopeptide (TPR) repeat protein
MLTKFKWGNIKNAAYLDPESTRMISIIIKSFNQLAESLLREGKTAEAKKVLLKELEVVPEKNHLFYNILHKYYTADLLYQVGEVQKASKLVEQTASYINQEVNYLTVLSKDGGNLTSNDMQLGVSVYNELIKITEKHKQTALNAKLKNQFKIIESKLMQGM